MTLTVDTYFGLSRSFGYSYLSCPWYVHLRLSLCAGRAQITSDRVCTSSTAAAVDDTEHVRIPPIDEGGLRFVYEPCANASI
jgi:hypothetical protein